MIIKKWNEVYHTSHNEHFVSVFLGVVLIIEYGFKISLL